ncbi:hypothetical protein [Phytomonospora endophytica]|uniref:CBS domain-containing protein n=1 Tax=Phytomonospora endophytica TaxID=714109 RepID=A0A841FUA7_9ACTN|nr:hypothetical protein [Phytomonospora endophytica]MBB6036927.1 CBS domain-containing protein [Phytomonospora endophytica]GIG68042.1 histidine kinase [Phytomonospora endophytica]
MFSARLLAGQDLSGLIVVDDEDMPCKVLPGTQVLRMAVPAYRQDDPVLARVIDAPEADLFPRELGARTVGDGLDQADRELPVVDGDATALEIASVMAASSSPVAAVAAEDRMLGAITLDALLDRMLDLG